VDLNSSEAVTFLLEPLYDAAADPKMWPVFLQKASDLLRADKAVIVLSAPGNEHTRVCVEFGISPNARLAIESMNKLNPWMAEVQKRKAEGWYSGSPEDEMPMDQFRKSRFYREVLEKYDIEWMAKALVFERDGWMPGFSVSRPRSGRPFGCDEKILLKRLVPHLGRAFKAYRAIGMLRDLEAAGQHALDLTGASCVTLDTLGRVISFNRRAESLIESGGHLRIRDRRLRTVLIEEQKVLDTCVLKACACGASRSTDSGEGVVVLHSAQGRAMYVSALPFSSNQTILDDRPAALLFITPFEEQGHGDHRLWQKMFGLSPAECRVAEMMKQGMEVGEISESIRIKVDTVRYYQKCIYRKMGVRGQGQMMRLLTRLPLTSP